MRFSTITRAVVAIAIAATAMTPAQAEEGCASGAASGGEWTTYGHDLLNTRTQPDETTIGRANVGALAPTWIFSAAKAGRSGTFEVTPIVANGCVYVGTNDGWVFALNADTGALVWNVRLPIEEGGYGGRIVGSLAAHDGKVFVHGNENGNPDTGKGPFTAALDPNTGGTIWSTVVDSMQDAYTNASPIVFDGMVFSGFAGLESSQRARGGYAILDEDTGEIIFKRYTISDDDYGQGYAGASIWSTAAIDPDTKYGYVGTGNPSSKKIEHLYTNAIVKIDLSRARGTFGQIVASYKGNADQYYKTLGEQPACDALGDDPRAQYLDIWSAPCGQLDLDFGASPNLFRTADGEMRVGALQKAGVYHVASARTMEKRFDIAVGAPCFACNASSSAALGDKIFVVGTPGGQMVSVDGSQNTYRWASPVADGLHYQPVSVANGVAYVVDLLGNLNGYDADTGVPLLRRDIGTDTGEDAGGVSSSGVAIARNAVYAATGGTVVMYR